LLSLSSLKEFSRKAQNVDVTKMLARWPKRSPRKSVPAIGQEQEGPSDDEKGRTWNVAKDESQIDNLHPRCKKKKKTAITGILEYMKLSEQLRDQDHNNWDIRGMMNCWRCNPIVCQDQR